MKTGACLFLVLLGSAFSIFADEPTRCVQEELRKRNFYFGEIDGRMTPELSSALKRYQARKNLAVSGMIDDETASSLNVQGETTRRTTSTPWPEVPVLRSDVASKPTELEKIETREVKEVAEETASPAPPAESPVALQSPAGAENISREKVMQFIAGYLRAAEGDDITAQVRYYARQVRYFDDGLVDLGFVRRDTGSYNKRWRQRHYHLVGTVALTPGSTSTEVKAAFTAAFSVSNAKHSVSGRTRNYWTIRDPPDGELQIVAIREERLRE